MNRIWSVGGVLVLVGCQTGGGPQSPGTRIPPGTASRAYDSNGDGTPDGQQFDLDGDGRFDAIDLDGDGYIEGGDFDGDGVVTDFTKLKTGATAPSAEQLAQMPADVDPDFRDSLDPQGGFPAEVTAGSAVDLSASLPSVLSQGNQMSCAAFAAAVVGSQARAVAERSSADAALVSPAFLYERMTKASMTTCPNQGTMLHTGLLTLIAEGAPAMSVAPYDDKQCAQNPPATDAYKARIGGFAALHPFTRGKAKEFLASGVPIPFGCELPEGFMKLGGPDAKNVFQGQGNCSGDHCGGHAMVIVGYDDARAAYKVWNSWGADWGDRGYVWWGYDALESRKGLHAFAPTLLPEAPTGPLPMVSPQELELQVLGIAAFSQGGQHRVVVRLKANGPISIDEVSIAALNITEKRTWVLVYGDVSVTAAQAVAPGMYELAVSGNANGQPFTRMLPITVAEEQQDPGM